MSTATIKNETREFVFPAFPVFSLRDLAGSYIFEKEKQERACLSGRPLTPTLPPLYRARAVHWIHAVNEQLMFRIETVSLGVQILDRFLTTCTPNNFQATDILPATITSLHLASKLEEEPLTLSEYIIIARDGVTPAQLCQMEWRILAALGFQPNLVTPALFLAQFQDFAEFRSSKMTAASHYILNLALAEIDSNTFWPSLLAAAIVLLCRSLEGNTWTPSLIAETGYQEVDLLVCVSHLQKILKTEAHLQKAHSISLQYAKKEFHGVSNLLLHHFRH